MLYVKLLILTKHKPQGIPQSFFVHVINTFYIIYFLFNSFDTTRLNLYFNFLLMISRSHFHYSLTEIACTTDKSYHQYARIKKKALAKIKTNYVDIYIILKTPHK